MQKLILTTAFIISASAASAMCDRGHKQAMTCAQGQSYDSEKGVCVPLVNS